MSTPDGAAPTGTTERVEWLVRITLPDGRIRDHGPVVDRPPSKHPQGWRCPPGSTLVRLRRTVTVVATEWEEVDDGGDG